MEYNELAKSMNLLNNYDSPIALLIQLSKQGVIERVLSVIGEEKGILLLGVSVKLTFCFG